jgi:hypothetical protein
VKAGALFFLVFLRKALAPVVSGKVSIRNPRSCHTGDDSRSRELDAGAQESQAGLTQELTSIAGSSLDQMLPEALADFVLSPSVPSDVAEIR